MLYFKKYQKKLSIVFLAVTVLAVLASPAVAEDRSDPLPEKPVSNAYLVSLKPDEINGEYFKDYLNDTGKIVSSPSRWDGDDWMAATLIIGATSGIYLADTEIRELAQRNQNSVGDGVAKVGNTIGNPFVILPSLGLFYLYGQSNSDQIARKTALLAVESLVISTAFVTALKLATQRHRPLTGESSSSWDGPGVKNLNSSFPSIHTQSAFAVASVIAEAYGSNPYIPPVVYGLATMTGASRIYSDNHWTSDVFFGGVIGYFVGKAVVSLHTLPNNYAVRIIPVVSQQGFGITAEYRF